MTSAHPRDMADVDDVPSNALAPPPPSSLSSLRTPRVAPRSSSLGVAAASAVGAGAGKEAETSAPPRVAEGDEAISSLSAVEPDAARAAAGGATDSARQRQRQRPRADSNLSDRSSTSSVTSVAESEAGTGLSSGAGPSRSRTSTIRRRVGTSGPATDDDDAGAMTAQPAAARDKEMLVPERIDSLGAQLLLQEDTASDALLPLSATSSSGLPAPRPSQYFLGHASKRDDSHGSIEFLQSSSSGSSEDVTLSFAPVRLEEPVPAAGAKGLQGDAEAPRRTSENAERDGPKDAVLGDVSTNPRRVGKAGSRFIEDLDIDVSLSDLRASLASVSIDARKSAAADPPVRRRSFLLRRRERSRALPTTVIEDADEVPALTREFRASSVSSSASSSIALETDVSPTTEYMSRQASTTKRNDPACASDSDQSEIVSAQQAREILHRSGGLLAPRPHMGSRSNTSPDALPTRATLHKVQPGAVRATPAAIQAGQADRRASIAIVVNDHSAQERRTRQQRPKSTLLQLHTKTLPAPDSIAAMRDTSPPSNRKRRPLSGLFRRTSSSSRRSAIVSPRSELTEDEAINWREQDAVRNRSMSNSSSGVSGWQRFVKRVVGGGTSSPEVERASFDYKDRRSSMSSSASDSLRWRSSATASVSAAAHSGDESQQPQGDGLSAIREDANGAVDDGLCRNNTVKPRQRTGTQSTRSQRSVESFEPGHEETLEHILGGHGRSLIAGRI